MATLTSSLSTAFIPAVGSFNVQSTGGAVILERRQTSGAVWAAVGVIEHGVGKIVDNPVAAAEYRFTTLSGAPTVQADQ